MFAGCVRNLMRACSERPQNQSGSSRLLLVALVHLLVFPAPVNAAAPSGRYTYPGGTVTSSSTVYDTVTKLTWQRAIPANPCPSDGAGLCTLLDAQTYCSTLSLGGYTTGWRLPTVKELMSIIDISATSPAVDQTAFPSTPIDHAFLTPTFQALPSRSDNVLVSFNGRGSPTLPYPPVRGYVRCVR